MMINDILAPPISARQDQVNAPLSSTFSALDSSSQSSRFPHLRRSLWPPSTAHEPQLQNLKSWTVLLSMISPHFLHLIAFLIILGIIILPLVQSGFFLFLHCRLYGGAGTEQRTSPKRSSSSYLALPAYSRPHGNQFRPLRLPARAAYPSD